MKKYTKLAIVSVLSSTIAACSSDGSDDTSTILNDDSNTPVVGDVTTEDSTDTNDSSVTDVGQAADPVDTSNDTTTPVVGDDNGSLEDDTPIGNDTDLGNDTTDDTDSETVATDNTDSETVTTDDTDSETVATDDADSEAVATDETDSDTDDTTTEDTGGDEDATDADADVDESPDTNGGDRSTPSGRSALGNPPTLRDPFADATPSPDSSDWFGTRLEVDTETPVAGGAPTTPKNLRVDLISNDWAEINWAPSNDDVAVVEYRIYRSDEHVYVIREDDTSTNGGAQSELDKYWLTTSFIDCNYTRFSIENHACALNGPSPGDIFSYQVTAVDADGQESPRSNSITIEYHLESNAPVPRYDDDYKDPSDTFAQDHDLSNTEFFLDKFDLVFEDNFDGPMIDESKWNTGLTWGDTRIINGEQQYFVNTQAEPGFGYNPFRFEDGELIIEAVPTPDEFVDSLPPVCSEADPSGNDRCKFLSGALSTHDKFGITYGYVEGRMKAGNIAGMLSSFYLYHRYPGNGVNLHGPEIDILEYLGENPFGDEDAFQTYHFVDPTYTEEDGEHFIRSAPTMFQKQENGELYGDDYHTFGVLWEPQLVIWYIDGKEIKRLSGVQVARQQMNIVTYLVAGSVWAPTPAADETFPLPFALDYIRAYQRPEYSTNGIYPDR